MEIAPLSTRERTEHLGAMTAFMVVRLVKATQKGRY